MMTDSPTAEEAPPSAPTEMIPISPHRASTLLANITTIHTRITSTLHSLPPPHRPVRLVAVSKLKPASDILALHTPPSSSNSAPPPIQSHFGENYVQELLEKSRVLPRTIKWHFIGGLQSNKCAQLAREVDSLWAVESVDSEKKAMLLNKGRGERNERLYGRESSGGLQNGEAEAKAEEEEHDQSNKNRTPSENAQEEEKPDEDSKLHVFIQINTSAEPSKSGLSPTSPDILSLARFITAQCPHLHLKGLMTIGALARSVASTPENENEDFITLRETRDRLAEQLGREREELELSMGMSEDFEAAVRMGSGEVRVGSTIFGERPARKDAKVLE